MVTSKADLDKVNHYLESLVRGGDLPSMRDKDAFDTLDALGMVASTNNSLDLARVGAFAMALMLEEFARAMRAERQARLLLGNLRLS